MEDKERIEQEIKRLSTIIDLLNEHDKQTEDIINQINFLEDLKFKIECMYENDDNEECFISKYEKEKESLEKSFDFFIAELNDNLGCLVQNIFFMRDKLKKNLELTENLNK